MDSDMSDLFNPTFRADLPRELSESAKVCLRQAWAERSGNGDPAAAVRVIDRVTRRGEWLFEEGGNDEILLRALEIATGPTEARTSGKYSELELRELWIYNSGVTAGAAAAAAETRRDLPLTTAALRKLGELLDMPSDMVAMCTLLDAVAVEVEALRAQVAAARTLADGVIEIDAGSSVRDRGWRFDAKSKALVGAARRIIGKVETATTPDT